MVKIELRNKTDNNIAQMNQLVEYLELGKEYEFTSTRSLQDWADEINRPGSKENHHKRGDEDMTVEEIGRTFNLHAGIMEVDINFSRCSESDGKKLLSFIRDNEYEIKSVRGLTGLIDRFAGDDDFEDISHLETHFDNAEYELPVSKRIKVMDAGPARLANFSNSLTSCCLGNVVRPMFAKARSWYIDYRQNPLAEDKDGNAILLVPLIEGKDKSKKLAKVYDEAFDMGIRESFVSFTLQAYGTHMLGKGENIFEDGLNNIDEALRCMEVMRTQFIKAYKNKEAVDHDDGGFILHNIPDENMREHCKNLMSYLTRRGMGFREGEAAPVKSASVWNTP